MSDLGVSLLCRDLRHGWEPSGDHVVKEHRGEVRRFVRTLECHRCACVRVDEYLINHSSLTRVRSRYVYPDGYMVKGGLTTERARFLLFKDAPMIESGSLGVGT